MPDSIRLNKYLAHATGISRREADELIEHVEVGAHHLYMFIPDGLLEL